jgi:hypothetical protein
MMYVLGNNSQMKKALTEADNVPWYLTILGLVVFGFASYMLWKNKTPLRRTWVNDFTNEELEAMANSQNNNEEQ